MNKKILLPIVLLSSLLSYSQENASAALDTTIDEIVIYNQRLQLPSSLKNRNLTVINQEQIKQLPVNNVNELLTYAAGVDIRQRGPFGTQADLSIDGSSFEQTLILLNGQKISDPQTGHNSLNIPVPLEAIERIEIVRGPSARLYGVNSLTGVVNIVTRNPQKDGLFANVSIGSSFKKDKEENGHGEVFNNRGIQLGGTILRKKHNHMLFGNSESGNGTRYNTAFNNSKLFYQGNYTPNENNAIMLLGGYARSSFGANGFYAAPNDKEAKEIVSTTMLNISSRHLLNDRFTLLPSIAYRYNFDDYQYYRHNLNVARSRHYTSAITSNVRAEYQADFAKISFGGEMRYEQINSTNIGNHSKSNYGLFAELQREFFERLDVNIGTYINYNTKYGWQVFPGVDASYSFNNNWKAVFNAGTSSRIPSFTDLYLDQRPGNVGNPDLQAETAYQIEFGGKYISKSWRFDAFAFYRDIDGFIDWIRTDASVTYQPYNAARNKTKGVNTALKYHLESNAHKWDIGVSYTYLDPTIQSKENDKTSKYAIESLRHQAIGTVTYTHKNLSATLANRYNERLTYKSYWVNDIKVSYNVDKYNFYLDAQNIFNTTYIEAGAVPMPGRWFTVGVKYNGL